MTQMRLARPADSGGAVIPRIRERGETYFGAVPDSDTGFWLAARSTPSDLSNDPGRAGGPRNVTLLRRFARLILGEWLLAPWRGALHETIIASHCSVEIRQTAAACIAWTCVKGDLTQARATALRRLAKYTEGDNRGAVRVRVVRPVLQRQSGPHRWRVGVRLANVENIRAAPAPLAPKIEVVASKPETLAIVRMDGRPSHDLVSFGDAIILDAISDTEWVAIGPAMIRLYTRGLIPLFIGGFEIAVPVSARDTTRAIS